MKLVGFVGWRGMVGSVLMQRMLDENDFDHIQPIFFSTSQAGNKVTLFSRYETILEDASNIKQLSKCDIIISTQGSNYTTCVFPQLRFAGWQGYWIDAASALRMKDDALIILDPINRDIINHALASGIKNYIGGNCTSSILLMGIGGLLKSGCVDWINSITYQAASGAGASYMRELLQGMGQIYKSVSHELSIPSSDILEIDRKVSKSIGCNISSTNFGSPLAGGLIPWIDDQLDNGQSREEWKSQAEVNKILGKVSNMIPIDGLCVRIGVMRCHSLALIIKLNCDLSLTDVENLIKNANQWIKFVPNKREITIKELIPSMIVGQLKIGVGRVRKLNQGSKYFSAFVIGDQLLWGAAEPLRRMLRILL